MQHYPSTRIGHFQKLLAANATADSYTSRTVTTTRPASAANVGIIDLNPGPNYNLVQVPTTLKLVYFGTDTANQTLTSRVYGWNKVSTGNAVKEWYAQLLAEFAITLGASTGAAGRSVVAADLFADTITVTTGVADQGVRIISNGADQTALALVEIPGCELLEIQFNVGPTTETAVSANALWALATVQF